MPVKVKICGIKNPELAYETVKAGADYIGLVFAKNSKRYVTVSQAAEICTATKLAEGKAVGVFMDNDLAEMESVLSKINLDMVQLHGVLSKSLVKHLPNDLPIIKAMSAGEYQAIDAGKDYLLFDYAEPGSGKTFDWQSFKKPKNERWFLAGGLTSLNVRQAIQCLQPYAVDVSSGVENTDGEKDLTLIKEFIQAAKGL